MDNRPASRKAGPEPDARYRITGRPAGKPDWDRQVPDNRPENQKTGPEPDAGYRITGQITGKPDQDRKL